jgi:hypothetical protein
MTGTEVITSQANRPGAARLGHTCRMPFDPEASWPTGDVLAQRPELATRLRSLIAQSAERLPGRLDALMTARVEQLRGRDVADAELAEQVRHSSTDPRVTAGERAVIAVTELFVIDVRAITNGGFDAVNQHYSVDEVAAISLRLALLEGMSKFQSLFPVSTGGFP